MAILLVASSPITMDLNMSSSSTGSPSNTSDDTYTHPSGAFSTAYPSGWVIDESPFGVSFTSPDGLAWYSINFTNTGTLLNQIGIEAFADAMIENWYGNFGNFEITTLERKPTPDQVGLLLAQQVLLPGGVFNIVSVFRSEGNIVYVLDFFVEASVGEQYQDLLAYGNTVAVNPEAVGGNPLYEFSYSYGDLENLYKFKIPYAWSTIEETGAVQFKPPDGSGTIFAAKASSPQALTTEERTDLALQFMGNSIGGEVTITDQKTLATGGEQYVFTTASGDAYSVMIIEQLLETTYLLFGLISRIDFASVHGAVFDTALSTLQMAAPWSAESWQIVFQSDRDGDDEIYLMDADGSSVLQLTNNDVRDGFAAWSPDGTRIAYTSAVDDNEDIYIMNADGSDQTRLTEHPANDSLPTWSPDGNQIAFTSNRDGNYEIYLLDVEDALQGSAPQNITNHPQDDIAPSWSPDGSQIAFTSDRGDSNLDIYYLNLADKSVLRLTETPWHEWFPSWSPDGTRLAYCSEQDENKEIYIINADGTSSARITIHESVNNYPKWSPDGKRITFSSGRSGNADIFGMQDSGLGITNLTSDSLAGDVYSSFRP